MLNKFRILCLGTFAVVGTTALVAIFGYLLYSLGKSIFLTLWDSFGLWAVPMSIVGILTIIGIGFAIDLLEDDKGYL